ncbi:MAG: rhomboid family intramembrane serine protease [Lewinellaceae bacterium]|nr:rhomboid family intramembrane serine protease [Saprospiraceae bacterium]MCB9340842.1 rhomboid family intramembrane serine protease [Lewinellaceae bacterium]
MTITLILIVVTAIISWQAFSNREMFYKFMHHPYEEVREKQYYRWLTSIFLHGSTMHLFINMFVLYQFGTIVEQYFLSLFGETMGRLNFLLLYLLSGVFADIPTFYKHKDNQMFSSVGASGAVSGILFAYVIFDPWAMLLLFFIIPVPAIIAAVLYLGYSSYASRKGGDRIDHDAHFYGAVFGFLFTIALKPGLFNFFVAKLSELPF